MKRIIKKKICERCGAEFFTSKSAKRFCSEKCRRSLAATRHHYRTYQKRTHHCKTCGAEISSKMGYCSAACKKKPKRTPVVVGCENCGLEFIKRNNKKYCTDCASVRRKTERKAYRRSPVYRNNLALSRRRRKNRERDLPATLTTAEWENALAHFENRCAYCGEPLDKAHQEHFIPASLGGGYVKDNIIPSCPTCNTQKGNKRPLDWLVAKEHGLVTYTKIWNYLTGIV